MLRVAGGANDREKNACWLRLRQFYQGPATDKCKWEWMMVLGLLPPLRRERRRRHCEGDFMQGTARAEQQQDRCAEMCGYV